MRVLHLGKYYPPVPGGMEYFLRDLLHALTARGIEVAALVHSSHRETAPHNPIPLYQAPVLGKLLYTPLSPSFPRWLHRAIRNFRPQLLHLHLPNPSAFAALFSPLARALPWVVHWHSDVVPSGIDRRLALAYRFYKPLEERVLARSRRIIASSPDYLDASVPLQPWRNRCRMIPLGLDPQRLPEPSSADRNWAEGLWGRGHLRVLSIGRLTYYKGHAVLLEAAAQLAGVRVVLAGGGEQRRKLARQVQRLGLGRRVQLCGTVSESQRSALLSSCQVLCLPSLERTEAFGLVLLEAMAFGKPVVASQISGSGVGWVVRQGGHGLLVPPNQPNDLAQAIAMLRDQPALRQKLGAQGARALQQVFQIRSTAKQVKTLYQEILHGA